MLAGMEGGKLGRQEEEIQSKWTVRLDEPECYKQGSDLIWCVAVKMERETGRRQPQTQREMAGGGGVAESVLCSGNRETFILWMESQDLVTDWTWR